MADTSPTPLRLNRAIFHIGGSEAQDFLQGLITVDIEHLKAGEGVYGALLTPQGKIIADFFIAALQQGYLVDCHPDVAQPLMQRIKMYILRSDVTIENVSDQWTVYSQTDQPAKRDDQNISFVDPRLPALGFRHYANAGTDDNPDAQSSYDHMLVEQTVPQFGPDFQSATAFPHDVAMDALNGVDFAKGCFVGQEVVSRMKHRGTARRRPVRVDAAQPLKIGADLTVNGNKAGTISSVAGSTALAIARIDKLSPGEAPDLLVIDADGQSVTVEPPSWSTW